LTPENLNAPWILYEAGALSKALDDETRLCTYLLGGLQFQDIDPPLGMFQATKAEKEETRRLIQAINVAISNDPVPDANLQRIFDAMWPRLDEKLRTMPGAEEAVVARRSTDEMIAEVLEISRAEANRRRKTDNLDIFLPLFDELVPILPHIREALRMAKNQIMLAGSIPATTSGASTATGGLTVTGPVIANPSSTSAANSNAPPQGAEQEH
jgi:hypothetical protein